MIRADDKAGYPAWLHVIELLAEGRPEVATA